MIDIIYVADIFNFQTGKPIGLPLFERLKFLSIYSSNLDEFYMVRVGHLFDHICYNHIENKTNMSPKDQIDSINNEVRKLSHLRDKAYFEIMKGKNKTFFGVIPLPHNIERIFVLPGKKKFLLLEDIILTYANFIYCGKVS